MKFKFYDILSHIIPGFVVYLVYLEFTGEKFDKDFAIPATVIAFVLGYFVNTLASWAEDFYYWTWGGKPSNNLIDGKDIWKVRFYEHGKTKIFLEEDYGEECSNNDILFGIAMRHATPDVNSRVADFNASYAFSRVILTTILIASGLMIYLYYDFLEVYFVAIPLITVAWYRCKQRAYYFAREVLKTYLNIKKQE